GPVTPVRAVLILAKRREIGSDKAVVISPDGLHEAGPGVADAHMARAFTRADFIAVVVIYHRVDARQGGTGATGLHGVHPGYRTAQKATIFSLPPGTNDDGFALADDLVVPTPCFRLDGLANRRHVLEVVIVLCRFIRADAAQRAYGSG